jgi:hypothetical protein
VFGYTTQAYRFPAGKNEHTDRDAIAMLGISFRETEPLFVKVLTLTREMGCSSSVPWRRIGRSCTPTRARYGRLPTAFGVALRASAARLLVTGQANYRAAQVKQRAVQRAARPQALFAFAASPSYARAGGAETRRAIPTAAWINPPGKMTRGHSKSHLIAH